MINELLNNLGYTSLLELAQEGAWIIDETGQTMYVNSAMANILRTSIEELSKSNFLDYIDEAFRPAALENLQRRKEGIKETHEFTFTAPDKSLVHTLIHTTPIFHEDKFVGAFALVTDITKQKKQVEILEHSIDWYVVLKSTPEDIEIVYANKIARESCTSHFSKFLRDCLEFENLYGTVKQVSETKERVNLPQYVIPRYPQKSVILDVQIYCTNGYIVICGRDLEPIIYEFRANTALLNHKLEQILKTMENN